MHNAIIQKLIKPHFIHFVKSKTEGYQDVIYQHMENFLEKVVSKFPSILMEALNKGRIKVNSNTDLKKEYFNIWESFKRVAKTKEPSFYSDYEQLKNICHYDILLDEEQSELITNAIFENLHSFLLQIADLILSYKSF